jgi:hypothetical protein
MNEFRFSRIQHFPGILTIAPCLPRLLEVCPTERVRLLIRDSAKHLRDEPDADRPERPKVPRVTSAKSAVVRSTLLMSVSFRFQDCLNRIHDSDGSIWVDSNREFDTFITHGDEKEVRSLAREMKGEVGFAASLTCGAALAGVQAC